MAKKSLVSSYPIDPKLYFWAYSNFFDALWDYFYGFLYFSHTKKFFINKSLPTKLLRLKILEK